MASKPRAELQIAVRFLDTPALCLWCWDIADAADRIVESGWDSRWMAYPSPQEALTTGLARLADLTRTSRGAFAPGRRASRRGRMEQIAIVARDRPELYHALRRAFAGDERMLIVRDRRFGERRGRREQVGGVERRRGDRRRRPDVDTEVRSSGWALVRLGNGARRHRTPSGRPRLKRSSRVL